MNEVFDIDTNINADLQIIKHIQNKGIKYLISCYNKYFSNHDIDDISILEYLSTYFKMYLKENNMFYCYTIIINIVINNYDVS